MVAEQMTEEQVNELFAHLEQLLAEREAMEAEAQALVRGRAAEAVLACERYYLGQEAEVNAVLRRFAAAEEVRATALEAGDDAAAEAAAQELLYFGNQKSFREGALKDAERKLQKALAEEGFTTVEDARAASVPKDELERLAAKVEAYKQDFAETFAACSALEGGEE